MSDKRYVPVEEQSFSFAFFVLSGLLTAVTFWAVYDETFSRRPWKDHQQRFGELQLERAAAELEAATKARASEPVMARDKAMRAELEKVRGELEQMRATGDHTRAMGRVADLDKQIVDQKQVFSFRKSESDQYYYEWKHAEHQGYSPAAVRALAQKYADRLAECDAVQAVVDGLERERADVHASYTVKEQRIAALEADLRRLDGGVEAAQRNVDGLQRAYPEVVQVVNEDLHVVDRCLSCHVGVQKSGFEDPARYAQVYRTHPHASELFGAHPVDTFGCTPCHGGQGSATQALFAHAQGGELGLDPADYPAAFHKHYWERPLLLHDHELVVERDDAGEPTRSVHIPFLQASCRGCHAQDRDLPHAPALSRARRLVELYGCHGCHNIPGMGPEDIRKVGPSLTGFQAKSTPGWLVRWIANPSDFRPTTRMPNFWPEALDAQGRDNPGSPGFQRREQEATAIAAYVWANGDAARLDPTGYDPAADPKEGERLVQTVGCLGCHAIGPDDDARLAAQRKDGVQEPPRPGQPWGPDVEVVVSDHGPSLTGVGSKLSAEWIYAWVKNPKAYWPETRMPSLRLSDGEASAIANFLAGWKAEGRTYATPQALAGLTEANLAAVRRWDKLDDKARDEVRPVKALVDEGARLVSKYGCYGCHDIAGYETAGKVAPDLATIGGKERHLLDFGDYITNPDWQSWEAFVYNKLKSPRVFAHPRAELKMPWFNLAEQDILDIMVFLKSLTPEAAEIATDYKRRLDADRSAIEVGRRLVEEYNCVGCHVIEGRGGLVRTRYTQAEQNTSVPPFLTGQGGKVHADWFFGFLNAVQPLRPWLQIRMPSFGMPEEHAEAVVHYFTSFDGRPWPFEHQPEPPLTAEQFAEADALYTQLKCEKCHPADAATAAAAAASGEGGLAPRLDLARDRLRPGWLLDWLRDPESLQPGTRMPAFFYSFGSTDATDWWEDLEGGPSRVRSAAGGAAKVRVFAGSLPEGDDLRIAWEDVAGNESVVHVIEPGWQTVDVERFAWPAAGVKTDETPPSIAQVALTTPDGRRVSGLLDLRPAAGGGVLLQGVSASYPDAERRISMLVDYLQLLPRKDEILARHQAEVAAAGDAAATSAH